MEIKTISSIFGVLGFFISIATFILTRLERRKKLLVELYRGTTDEYSSEYANFTDDNFSDIIKIRVTNIDGQPVVINPESFYFIALSNKLKKYDCDWFGIDAIPSLLNVGSSCEVAVHVDSFVDGLGLKVLEKYCNQADSRKTIVPLVAGLKDHTGKNFITNKFKYFYYVGEIERVT